MSDGNKLELSDAIAEKSVLSVMLSDKDVACEILEALKPDMFTKISHRVIFEAAYELNSLGLPVDMVTIQGRLSDSDKLDTAGGASSLIATCNFAPNPEHWEDYANIVEDKWKLRRLQAFAGAIEGIVHDPEILTTDEKIERTYEGLTAVDTRKSESEQDSMKDIVREVFKVVDHALETNAEVRPGIPTGIKALDKIVTGGLRRGSNIIIAARPSMGKTSLGRHIAVNICQSYKVEPTEDEPEGIKYAGCFISLEVPRLEWVRGAMSMIGKYPVAFLEGIALNDDKDYQRVADSAEILQSLKLDVRDTTESFTVGMIRTAITRTIRKYGHCDFVMIDYMQLMSDETPSKRSDNRAYELKRIAQRCKDYAKKYDIPIVILAQVSRAVDQRDNKRPQMTDIGDSSGIENAADLILCLYREAYYVARETDQPEPDISEAEIIVRKNRQGRIGTAKVAFQPSYARFGELQGSAA